METITGNKRRSNLRGSPMGNQEGGMEDTVPVPSASASGHDAGRIQKRGNTRSASKEKVRRSAPATDRNSPETKQLIEWVDSVGVRRASEVLGEAPSTIRRWGVTHTPSAKHLEAFRGFDKSGNNQSGEQVQEEQGLVAEQGFEDEEPIEYVDNRPIEDATPLIPDDPKKLQEVSQFSHGRISKPSAIKAKLIGRNGEVISSPINTLPRQQAQPRPIQPVHNEEVGGRKIMTEAEYKALMAQSRDPVNSPSSPQQQVVVQPPQPIRKSAPEPIYSNDDAEYVPRGTKVATKTKNSEIDASLELIEQNKERLSEQDLQRLRNIFFPWQGKKVFIAFPVMKLTNPATAWTIAQLFRDLGDKCGGDLLMGNSNIDHARNILADKFLRSQSEWMFFLDDDVVPPTGRPNFFKYATNPPEEYPDELAGVHVIEQLLSHGKTLVGGLYFGRQAKGAPVFHEGLTVREAHLAARSTDHRELRATEWFATGCMMIHRSVFESMKQAFPKLKVDHEDFEYDFFQKIPGSGEDASFCRRAKQAGHQPYIDLKVRCAHVGFCAWGSWNTDSNIR